MSTASNGYFALAGAGLTAAIGFIALVVTQWRLDRREVMNDARRLRDAKRERLRILYIAIIEIAHEMEDVFFQYKKVTSAPEFDALDGVVNDMKVRADKVRVPLLLEDERTQEFFERYLLADGSLRNVAGMMRERKIDGTAFPYEELRNEQRGVLYAISDLTLLANTHLAELESTNVSAFLLPSKRLSQAQRHRDRVMAIARQIPGQPFYMPDETSRWQRFIQSVHVRRR